MPDVIATVTTSIGIAKQLLELLEKSKDVKAKSLLADLQIELAEVKMRLAELIEENTQFKARLKKAESAEQEVVLKDGLYFRPDGDGPFCTACYDSKGKLIRVSKMPRNFETFGNWQCNVCQSNYE